MTQRLDVKISSARLAAGVLLAAMLAQPGIAAGSGDKDAQQHHKDAEMTPYVVKGFRNAHFGMTEDELRRAIIKDLGVSASAIKRVDNPANGTAGLVVQVAKYEPGPGPATFNYVLGHSSRTLMHVNVVWLSRGDDAARNRLAMIGGAERLKRYFLAQRWRGNVAMTDTAIGPHSVVAFLAKDEKGASVEVRLDGVALTRQDSGGTVTQTPLPQSVRLRVSYALNPDKPDIAKLEPGKF